MGKEVEGASSASTAGSDLWTPAPETCPAEASRNAPQTSQYLQLTQSLVNANALLAVLGDTRFCVSHEPLGVRLIDHTFSNQDSRSDKQTGGWKSWVVGKESLGGS